MPRFAANLSFMFNEVPFLDRFTEAARAGFKAVEYAFPYQYPAKELAARLRDNGLEQVLINAPPGDYAAGDRGVAALPGREHEFAAGIVVALRYAAVLECPRIHLMAGVVPEELDIEQRNRHRSMYMRNLRYAAEEAAAQGVTLTIEPINPRDIPGYFLQTQAEAHAIRQEVGVANLKVQMDLYHVQIVEGDLAEKIKRWLPQVAHIQIAGVPGRHEPSIGEINYPYLFALIDELGYDGWIGCEYRPLGSTTGGLGWMKTLAT